MTVDGGKGKSPGCKEILALAERHDLKASEAQSVIDEVVAAVARWTDFAEAAGVGEVAQREVKRHLT